MGGGRTARERDSRRTAVSPRLRSGGRVAEAGQAGSGEDTEEKASAVVVSVGSNVQGGSSPAAVLDRKDGMKDVVFEKSDSLSSSSGGHGNNSSNGVIAGTTASRRQLQDCYYFCEEEEDGGGREHRRRRQDQQRQRRRGIPAAMAECEVQETQSCDEFDNVENGGSSSSRTHGNKGQIMMGVRDNDARMFLLERGLSQGELRRVMPVMRRDSRLISDVAVLATRMQVK